MKQFFFAKLLLIIIIMSFITVIQAQDPTIIPPTEGVAQGNPNNIHVLGFWDSFMKWFQTEQGQNLWTGLTAILGASLVFAANRIRHLNQQLNRRVKQIFGLMSPLPPKANEVTNSIMVVGIGGVGKTTLIKNVLGNYNIKTVRTDTYKIYSSAVEIPANQPATRSKLYMSDYVGQNLGNLISSFIEQQRLPYSPMRYGYVQSLIIVVDLFEVQENADLSQQNERFDTFHQPRIDKNLDMWNDQALDAVMGLLPGLDYLCLFINKSDKLRIYDNDVIAQIHKAYAPLRERLNSRNDGLTIKTIIGSAAFLNNINELQQDLIHHSTKVALPTNLQHLEQDNAYDVIQ